MKLENNKEAVEFRSSYKVFQKQKKTRLHFLLILCRSYARGTSRQLPTILFCVSGLASSLFCYFWQRRKNINTKQTKVITFCIQKAHTHTHTHTMTTIFLSLFVSAFLHFFPNLFSCSFFFRHKGKQLKGNLNRGLLDLQLCRIII